MRRSRAWLLLALAGLGVLAILPIACATTWGRDAVLHPWRRSDPPTPRIAHADVELAGEGIALLGWRFPAQGERRGLLVYLHGIADDRRGAEGVARRFAPLGLDVLAYDSRAHGASGGDACTYGVLEKRDLARVLDAEPPGPVVLLGGSLGAAVALQAAADDPRVALVVAIAPFSDLRTVASERAPFFLTAAQVAESLRLAGESGGFDVDDASPVAAAPRIRCPVLLFHGAEDRATPPDHSRRIGAALGCPHELAIVPGLGHDDPLGDAEWERIERAVRLAVRR